MKQRCSFCATTFLLIACQFLALPHAEAISIGEIADFQSDNDGWMYGQGSWPIISTGGPAGAADAFLQADSVGDQGFPPKLVAINRTDPWRGDYLAAGVQQIQVDLINLGETDLAMRLGFESFSGVRAASTDAVSLPVGSGWQQATFTLDAASLTIAGPSSVSDLLSNVAQIRFQHAEAATYVGTSVVATLGIDNITALSAVGFDPADFNEDEFVDEEDLNIWQSAYAVDNAGDANDDSASDGADFLIWQRNYAPLSFSAQAVPEPSTCALLGVAACCIAFRRKRLANAITQ